MAIDFRCENCGKLLSVEADPSSKIKCPYCNARVAVSAGLASLHRPQVPSRGDYLTSCPEQPSPPPVDEEIPISEKPDALIEVMATLMPWVISLFFHAGVLVILAFIMIVTARKALKANVVVPEIPLSENLGGRIKPGEMSPELTAKSLERAADRWAERDSRIPSADLGRTENKISLYGSMGGAAAGGADAPLGLLAGGGKPKPRFFGLGGNAYHIVYVVDCSGSMFTEFEMVRRETIKSFSKLSPQQTFHIIFFAEDKFKESPTPRLVFATNSNKRNALEFIKSIKAEGFGSSPIPALIRAFEVLKRAPGRKEGKLIYLLTDGEFGTSGYSYKGKDGNEAVLAWLRDNNKSGEIHINTILHHHHSPDVMKVLGQIASQNGGKFKFVKPSE